MTTQFRETMKVHTALSTEKGDSFPTIWCKFDFDPEFKENSYEFQYTYVSEIFGAMKSLLEELSWKRDWEEKMELAETGDELRDIARDMLEKIDDGFFDDDGGEERRKRKKMN